MPSYVLMLNCTLTQKPLPGKRRVITLFYIYYNAIGRLYQVVDSTRYLQVVDH